MPKPTKRAIAVLIQRNDRIFSVRRAQDDDEFPGIWGLPAASFRNSETFDMLIRRIGEQKLGVTLIPLRKLAEGTQDRIGYRLEMELWEVQMEGTFRHPEWQWAGWNVLDAGRAAGSLCCDLALKGKSRGSL